MTSFTFLSSTYLFGALAALIPLIIHLSRSRRTRKMRFSTTRFFTDQFLRSYRMSRLKEIFLLSCRMALFALLAMALARPFFAPPGATAAGGAGGGPRSAILVLDDSASMGVVEEGKTLFQRAQQSANSILASLGSGDTATVVLAGRRASGPEILFPEPTADLDDVKAVIAKRQVSALGTDLGKAITRAEELASGARSSGRSATIFVLSDLQKSGWDDTPGKTVSTDLSDIGYVFVNLSPAKPPANRAVTAVRYAATRPRVGMPFDFRPLLALGTDNTKDVTVRLIVDDAKVREQKVERLPGGKWESTHLHHTFSSTGWHAGYVEIDDDGLAVDNRRYFALEIPTQTQTVAVLAVNGAPSSVAHEDELFFLRFALTAAPEGQKAPFDIRPIAPGEVASTDVKSYPLVILANVAELSEAAVEKLEDYVDKGGRLLVFLGDRVVPASYNRLLAGASRRHGGLLPATIPLPINLTGKVVRADNTKGTLKVNVSEKEIAFEDINENTPVFSYSGKREIRLTGKDFLLNKGFAPGASVTIRVNGNGQIQGIYLGYPAEKLPIHLDAGHIKDIKVDHRALAVFKAPKMRDLLGTGLTFKVLDLEASEKNVLMRSSTGLPLLCEKDFGKGKVMLFASTCDKDWTDFPTRWGVGYLIWSRAIAEYLTQSELSLKTSDRTGDVIRLTAPAEEKDVLWVKKPDGGLVATTRASDGSGEFEFSDTMEPGIYTVLRSDQKKEVGKFAVNLDSFESDLSYLPDGPEDETPEKRQARVLAIIKSRLDNPPMVSFISDPTTLSDALGKSRGGLRLWDFVLVFVLVIALFEPWLANQISGRLYAKTAKTPVVPGPQLARSIEIPIQPAAEEVRG